MKLRRTLIALSSIAITANLAVAVQADQSSNHSSDHGSQNFSYVGFRSHGLPTLDWRNKAQGGDSSSKDVSSVKANLQNGDETWLDDFASALGSNPRKGFTYTVGSASTSPISCHGSCQTLTGTIALIPVWVGNWAPSDITTWNSVLGNIVTSLGTGTANSVAVPGHVFSTNTLYYTSQGLTPPSLQWVANTSVTAPTATNVSDADVATDINNFISANPTIVPSGTTPVYMYIGASSTLLTSGFGTIYCGWHTYGTTSSLTNVPYLAFQNFTATYNKACSSQTTSPNGNVPLDAMASVMVHEIDETLQDPFLNAWYDSSYAESADKCAWTWGTLQKVGAARYNVVLGSLKYMIQQDWLENNLVTPTGTATGTACAVTG
jgi:hypothetical protein